MADQLQLRGGTTSEHSTFTGALREVTVDIDKDTLVVHDNATAGGHPLMRENGSNSALALGSAGTPSLKFTGDTNTGIYSPGADQLALSTNGTQRLLIDASGNVNIDSNTLYVDATNNRVGIGTSSVGDTLHVKGSSTYGGVIADNSAATGGGAFRAYRNGVQKAIFCADSWVTGTSSDDAAIYADAGGGIKFYTNNSSTAKAVLTSGGSLGIGTTSPFALLHVKADTNKNLIVQNGGADTIELSNYNTGDGYREVAFGGSVLKFNTGTAGGGSSLERARIDSSGRLLVGTSSAFSAGASAQYGKLQVVANSFSASTQGIVAIGRGQAAGASIASGAAIGTLVFTDNTGGEFAQIACEADAATGTNDYPGRLVFSTTADGASSPTERMRIGSNGNVGIGSINSSTIRLYVLGANTANTDYTVYTENSANTNTFHVRNDGVFCTGVAASSPYNNTTASAANVFITSGGILQRSTSSIKYKTDVRDAAHGLSELLSLRPVTYKGKAETDQGKIFGGLIAEEVHDAGLSEFVQYAEDGSPDALAYGNMVSLCIKAIQEQQAMIVELQAKIAALESA